MKLLAVDTATDACSVAVSVDGEIIERFALVTREHTRLILPMIEAVLAEAGLKRGDLQGLAFGRGPGSFTGVRIATGVIHGLALGLDLPVVPVSTLAAIAQDYWQTASETTAYVAVDARIGEIYWGAYQRGADGFAQLVGAEQVMLPTLAQPAGYLGVGLGSGWHVYHDTLQSQLAGHITEVSAEVWPRARAIAALGVHGFALGQAVAVEHAMPVYLRDKVAKTEAER